MSIKSLFAAAILAVIAFSGCCKKSNMSANALLPPSSYYMSAAIAKPGDASAFSALTATYVTALKDVNICTITGSDTSAKSIVTNFTFRIVNFFGEGAYTFDSSSATHADYETNGAIYTQTSFSSGIITITSIQGKNIYGTFTGTLTDGSTVTNGKFTALGKGF